MWFLTTDVIMRFHQLPGLGLREASPKCHWCNRDPAPTKTRPWAGVVLPNAVTSTVHDRMPVILDADSYRLWLDPGMQNVTAISELLKPYDARSMRCFPVSTRVNSVSNHDLECSRPVE